MADIGIVASGKKKAYGVADTIYYAMDFGCKSAA
jgi:hypothetical protein